MRIGPMKARRRENRGRGDWGGSRRRVGTGVQKKRQLVSSVKCQQEIKWQWPIALRNWELAGVSTGNSPGRTCSGRNAADTDGRVAGSKEGRTAEQRRYLGQLSERFGWGGRQGFGRRW